MQPFFVILGALFTVATSSSLGAILLQRLSIRLYRIEHRLFAFLLGSACFSTILFALCALKLARNVILEVLGLAIIGYAVFTGAWRHKGDLFPPLDRWSRWILAIAFGAFSFLYLVNAMAPEMSPDGMEYHLAVVAKYHRTHGFVPITTDMKASLPQGLELLFLSAFITGRHSAAAVVHFAFLVSLALLTLSYGRRMGHPVAGVAAAIFVYAAPVLGRDGTVAYNDIALAAVMFGTFYLVQIWDDSRNASLLVPIGILGGFAYAVKHTGVVALMFAIGFVAWKLAVAHKPLLRPILQISVVAAACILPWMAKNWIEVANPVAPYLANRIFPNRYVHESTVQDLLRFLRHYDLPSRWRIPWDVTVRGQYLAGCVGPLFLLTPLSFMAFRFPQGRRLLVAGAVFGLPYFLNIGTRFLIPAIPFFSLALALAFAGTRWLLLALSAAHAIVSWPGTAVLYAPNAWRIKDIPIRAALRIEPEDSVLSQNQAYKVARLIDKIVPQGAKVFAFSAPANAYLSSEVFVGFAAGWNEDLREIIWTPLFPERQPLWNVKFEFPQKTLRKIRVIQTAAVPDQQWSIAELRAFDGQSELPRAPEWRLAAEPNPWDVQLAFDNSPVTRWRSWRSAEPGMYIDVDFGSEQHVDSVLLESSSDASKTKVRLEGYSADTGWIQLADHPSESLHAPRVSLRRAATSELKARGIGYLVVDDTDIKSSDFRSYSEQWGIRSIAEDGSTRLYRIE